MAQETTGTRRRAPINREQLMEAALGLLGPNRSVSTLTLREIARAAGIAPNSFYRHFRDVDELAVALIGRAGESLRKILWDARERISAERSMVRTSVETFMQQLDSGDRHLPLLLREGTAGSAAFKQAVESQLRYFEHELTEDLKRIAREQHVPVHQPELVAQAITRLVFAMGGVALDLPQSEHARIVDETSTMIRMIMRGAAETGHAAER